MKKRLSTGLFLCALALASCRDRGNGHPPGNSADSSYIPVDSANKMIGSYIESINQDTTQIRSLQMNAAAVRQYLNSSEGQHVESIKISFAHTLDFINEGNEGRNCGYTSGQFTLVLSGYDAKGNYILVPAKTAMDMMRPCPIQCADGDAGGNFIKYKDKGRR